MKTFKDLKEEIARINNIDVEGFDNDRVLRKFARDQALRNIKLIRPYTNKYDLVVSFLVAGNDTQAAATAATAATAARAAMAKAAEVAYAKANLEEYTKADAKAEAAYISQAAYAADADAANAAYIAADAGGDNAYAAYAAAVKAADAAYIAYEGYISASEAADVAYSAAIQAPAAGAAHVVDVAADAYDGAEAADVAYYAAVYATAASAAADDTNAAEEAIESLKTIASGKGV